MDFRSKVEARRRELAAQQRKAERDADAKVASIAAKLDAAPAAQPVPVTGKVVEERGTVNDALVKQRLEKLVEKEAEKLMPKEVRNWIAILLITGIIICITLTWHGLWLVLASAIYYAVQSAKYKDMARQLIAEASEDVPV